MRLPGAALFLPLAVRLALFPFPVALPLGAGLFFAGFLAPLVGAAFGRAVIAARLGGPSTGGVGWQGIAPGGMLSPRPPATFSFTRNWSSSSRGERGGGGGAAGAGPRVAGGAL